MSRYSRALVVDRLTTATDRADAALDLVEQLRKDASEDRKTVEARLLTVTRILVKRIEPAERLAKAGFLARLRWFLRGTLPPPEPSIEEVIRRQATP